MILGDFEKEIKDSVGWMREATTVPPESTGDKDKDRRAVLDEIDDMLGGDIYEVHVDYHLTNGEIVKTRNHCLESYYKRKYLGDNAFVSDGWLYVEYNTNDGIFHQSRVKPESVCWIDSYNVDIDWKGYTSYILQKLKLL